VDILGPSSGGDASEGAANSAGKNRLGAETSPYLLQHKDNPVHWYSWGAEALAAAREQDKPILLSIGYSACHWCHVMAHESFEDPATADVMNEHFINIKVDREERPDIDKTYQLAHQLLTQESGGWPLTVFLHPESHLPLFSGTYFPKAANYQLPGFTDLLRRVAEAYASKGEELIEQGKKIAEVLGALQNVNPAAEGKETDYDQITTDAREQLTAQYDSSTGGFGGAPRFPNPTFIEFLFEQWSYSNKGDREALDMVMTSLTQMARGGIYDQLGGGFCRYATDKNWMIPHFEKMLYDNGALLALYADALRVGPDQLFEDAVTDTINWLTTTMRSDHGGFFAAQDADSDGEEGKYYVWQKQRVKRLLTEDEYLLVETLFGLDKPANFESRWNLHRRESWRSVTERIILDAEDPRAVWLSAKAKLLAERADRTPPEIDTKILASWNALAIDGIARAGMVLNRPDWIEHAQSAMDFIRTQMMKDGRLHATWKDGEARHPAYLDDYAFCLRALVTLLQVHWREVDIVFAQQLADLTIKLFAAESGGFYFTAHDHEKLIHRAMPTIDESTASGNAVLGTALTDLGHLMADLRYLDAASSILRWAAPFAERYPVGHCSMLTLAARHTHPQQQVILHGPEDPEWINLCRAGYTPNRHVFSISFGESVATLPAYLPRMVSAEARSRVTAYVCTGMSCSAPITELSELKELL